MNGKIGSFSSGTGSERRNELRSQWDNIRSDQSKIKSSRNKIVEQLKAMNENVAKKVSLCIPCLFIAILIIYVS